MSSGTRDTKALIARRCKPILAQLKTCCQTHGESCNGDVLGLGKDEFEINLIDVQKMCLVHHNSMTCGYFTLSYVWGGVQQYRLLRSNFDFLRQAGSLEAIKRDVPQIARDAIDLVRGLRGTYLWIDSLCIVQDDAEQKHHQIAHMTQIYSRSFLTIVAAEALDANSRLPCVHYTDTTRSEAYPGMDAPIDDCRLEEALASSKFGSRAWTYQEILLSRRRLFSYTNRVILQCGTGSWYSGLSGHWETPRPEDARDPLFPWPRSVTASEPSYFSFYVWVVGRYSCKDLSFASDIWPAFSGVKSALKSTLGCSFHHGLPERILDYALLWNAYPGDASMKRRCSEPRYPSWSWMGWTNKVYFPTFSLRNEQPLSVILAPLVKSIAIVSQDGSQPVESIFHSNPDGFLEEYSYKLPKEKNVELTNLQGWCQGLGPILQFHAYTTPVRPFWKVSGHPYDWNALYLSGVHFPAKNKVVLLDPLQKFVGTIENINREDLADLFREGTHLEIVALSVCLEDFSWCSRNEEGASTERFVNVMLIQCFDGSWERVAIGQIGAKKWEGIPRSWRCVQLV